MIRGIYTSCAGMGTQQACMETLSNNLVNASTHGYKADKIIQTPFFKILLAQSQSQPESLLPGGWEYLGTINQGAVVRQVPVNFAPGQIEVTGNDNHLAISSPDCFYMISSPTLDEPDRVLFTRDGVFHVDGEGYLVNARENRVQGMNGDIKVGIERFIVNRDGVISTVDGVEIDKLNIAQFKDLSVLVKDGGNCFTAPAGSEQEAVDPVIQQGCLECSNVDLADGMASMISIVRSYEANQRSLQAQNELLGLAVNKVGSLR